MDQDFRKISDGLTTLLDEVESLLESTAGEKGRETLQRLHGHLRNARGEIVSGAKNIDGAVHAHPWGALAATAIVSFLAGLLVRRR